MAHLRSFRTLLASGAATALIAIPTASLLVFDRNVALATSVSAAEVARQITASIYWDARRQIGA